MVTFLAIHGYTLHIDSLQQDGDFRNFANFSLSRSFHSPLSSVSTASNLLIAISKEAI
jgi:hypothetical protein